MTNDTTSDCSSIPDCPSDCSSGVLSACPADCASEGPADCPAENALRAYLAETPVAAELIRSSAEMPSVGRAAAALGVRPAAIVKSIVFEHKRDPSRVCLAIVCGDTRVSPSKVATALGVRQLRLASPDAVRRATGYRAGGVPPVGHRQVLPVVIDRRVLALEEVLGGGGDEWHMLRIAPRDIQRLTGAIVADVIDEMRGDEVVRRLTETAAAS